MALGIGSNSLQFTVGIDGAQQAKKQLEELAKAEKAVAKEAAKADPALKAQGASYANLSAKSMQFSRAASMVSVENMRIAQTSKQAATGANVLSAATSAADSKLRGLALSLVGVGTALAGLSQFKKAVTLASDFEFGLGKINTLLDDGGESVARFERQLLDLSLRSPKSLGDLNAALYQTISAGVDAADAMSVLTAAQQTAVASGASTEQAVNATVTMMSAYKDSMLSAAEANDMFFAAIPLGRVTIEDFDAELGSVATTAATFNVQAAEMMASLTTMTRAGISTAESTTSLQAAILSIASPSKDAAKYAESLGIELSAAALKSKGLHGVMEDIRDATGGSAAAMARLFPNVRALRGVAVLTGSEFRGFTRDIDSLTNSTGAAEEAVKKMEGSFRVTSELFKSQLEAVYINAANKVMPDLNAAVKRFGDYLVENKDAIADATKSMFDVMMGVGKFIIEHGPTILKFVGGLFAYKLINKATAALGGFYGLLKQTGALAAATGGKIGGGLTYGVTRGAQGMTKAIIGGLKNPGIFAAAVAMASEAGDIIGQELGQKLFPTDVYEAQARAAEASYKAHIGRMNAIAQTAGFGSAKEQRAFRREVSTGDVFAIGTQIMTPQEAISLGSGLVGPGAEGAAADIESQIERVESFQRQNQAAFDAASESIVRYREQLALIGDPLFYQEDLLRERQTLERELNNALDEQASAQAHLSDQGERLNDLYRAREDIASKLVYWTEEEEKARARADRAAQLEADERKRKEDAEAEAARKKREREAKERRAEARRRAADRRREMKDLARATKTYVGQILDPFRAALAAGEKEQSRRMKERADALAFEAKSRQEYHDRMSALMSEQRGVGGQLAGDFGLLGGLFTVNEAQREGYKAALDDSLNATLTFAKTGSDAIRGFSDIVGQSFAGAILNGDNFASSMKDAFGQYIVSMGTMALQQSAYLAIVGTLSSFFPVLGLPAGASAGAGALALAAFGTTAILAGRAMGAGGGRLGGGGVGAGGVASAPSLGVGRERGESAPTININLGISSQAVHNAVVEYSRDSRGRRGSPRVAISGEF